MIAHALRVFDDAIAFAVVVNQIARARLRNRLHAFVERFGHEVEDRNDERRHKGKIQKPPPRTPRAAGTG